MQRPAAPVVAMVLPPREDFAPGRSGAIGLLVHAAATAAGRFAPVVLGTPQAAPFDDVAFRPVRLSWLRSGATGATPAASPARCASCARR